MIAVPLRSSQHSFPPTAEFLQITSYVYGVGVDNEPLRGGEMEAEVGKGWVCGLGGF